MTDARELHVIEGFKELKNEYFSHGGWKGHLLFALLLDENVEAAGNVLHNDGEVAFLTDMIGTSLTNLRKYSRMLTILQCPILASMPNYLFLYLRS
jgi:hypothetical protein